MARYAAATERVAIEQIDAFLRTGTVIDVCDGEPCISPQRE